jgi:hypothetical protein
VVAKRDVDDHPPNALDASIAVAIVQLYPAAMMTTGRRAVAGRPAIAA